MFKSTLKALLLMVAILLSTPVFSNSTEGEKLDMASMIMHHIKDAHEWHIITYTDDNDVKQHVSVYLPIILIDGGIQLFSSEKLYHGTMMESEHGETYLANKELGYAIYHETIYKLNDKGELTFEHGHPTNVAPLDFSITKNVVALLFSALLLFILLRSSARIYKEESKYVPKGIAGFFEPIILFIRDEVAIANIGEKKYKKYLPYLLTIFFFIWINSLLGLIPIIPGGSNLTGNISFTLILAVFTLLLTVFSGGKHYWGHIFKPPGVPMALIPLMIPIEIVGIFTKPFALTVRLFANMTAGHIIPLALIGIIFTFESVAWSGLSVPMALFIKVLELLVGLLQAFIFTMLSSLFIGEAVAEH